MPEPKLTKPQRLGLLVIDEGQRADRLVMVSNKTTTPTSIRPTVYWQVARFLVDQRLADEEGTFHSLRLTPAGRVLAGKEQAKARTAGS